VGATRSVLNDHPLSAIMVAAVLAPLLAEIPIGLRLPVAVFEVAARGRDRPARARVDRAQPSPVVHVKLPVRLALPRFAVLAAISEEFGFQAIFGSFAAGLVVGLATRGKQGEAFRIKIDAVRFGWFTPFSSSARAWRSIPERSCASPRQ
jgi:hypothetical protein